MVHHESVGDRIAQLQNFPIRAERDELGLVRHLGVCSPIRVGRTPATIRFKIIYFERAARNLRAVNDEPVGGMLEGQGRFRICGE